MKNRVAVISLILMVCCLLTSCNSTPPAVTVPEETKAPCTTHQWKDATCQKPKTCSLCGETEGTTIEHTFSEATCQRPKTCSMCAKKDGDVANHNFVNGYCSFCSVVDKNSNEYKYDVLKKKADRNAFSCAETAISKLLKNPSSMKVLNEEILDSDEYFRYYVKIQYSAENSLGGTVTDDAYLLIRILPEMDGTFEWTRNSSGTEYPCTESMKTQWGWGTKPEDWSLDAAVKYTNPTEVSLKLILSNPSAYKGQIVKIKEKLVVIKNDLSNMNLTTYQSTGSGKYDYNSDNKISVFYDMTDNAEDFVMLDADYQKVTVVGEVKIYRDSTKPYIDAFEIVVN